VTLWDYGGCNGCNGYRISCKKKVNGVVFGSGRLFFAEFSLIRDNYRNF